MQPTKFIKTFLHTGNTRNLCPLDWRLFQNVFYAFSRVFFCLFNVFTAPMGVETDRLKYAIRRIATFSWVYSTVVKPEVVYEVSLYGSRRKRQSHCCECRRRVWSIYFRLRSDKQSNPSTEPPPPPLFNAGTKTIYRSLCWHDQTRRNDVGRNNHDVALLLDLDFY